MTISMPRPPCTLSTNSYPGSSRSSRKRLNPHLHEGDHVGKARGVPDAIRKGAERARKNMKQVPLAGTTIPHEVTTRYSAARVMLRPASPGTGVIAGGGVRAVVEAAGIRDILTKSLGSANILNVVRATIQALDLLKDPAIEAERRGVPVDRLLPFWMRGEVHEQ